MASLTLTLTLTAKDGATQLLTVSYPVIVGFFPEKFPFPLAAKVITE